MNKTTWLRDLVRFLPLKSQFVLSGNVRDLQAYEIAQDTVAALPLGLCLQRELQSCGYRDVISFSPTVGFGLPGVTNEAELAQVMMRNGLGSENPKTMGLEMLGQLLGSFTAATGEPAALIVDFASRLVNRSDALTIAEHTLFTQAQILCHAAKSRPAGPDRKPFYNSIIWIVERDSDLPDWLTVDNPKLRTIPVAVPDSLTRKSLSQTLLKSLPAAQQASEGQLAQWAETFVNLTEGLLLSDMNSIAQLGRNEGLKASEIADAVRRYKVGVTDDPWRKIDRTKIAGAEEFIRSRVKGQDHAAMHMLDIVKRAVTGVGRSSTNGRPRGVAFLAGPTGVGKTELAKTITSLLFGDESAYIRFDMSEFSAEHADQRLIGAPPGYVGYDAGGELTNAIREKPFSVVLFDEIEKAHPRILDKFLQVLDDGVLTSGRGDRVYFSEAIILFTSNLGIYRTDASGARIQNVSSDETHEVVTAKVREEIDRHFKLTLNRPEILNRIGENVIVFDFIRPQIADAIFDGMVANLLESTRSIGFDISITDKAKTVLKEMCLRDLSNGGRGVRNMVEAHLANPLSRALFDTGEVGGTFRIEELSTGAVTSITLEREQRPS
ncbi:ATP-dependent Clp protease ATP-binding subunit ClpA [Rhizobium pisi]|jgi:ATP-dependent Clp protease ATP-binding subunit ClpA|uniref:ATP-dependent Clp protease ATP-binding subunit n=1 Tax=Rhizobium pisi TaxID=574561 RepID=A0A427MBJ7_9HYPH|nr:MULTISPECIES: AAA family ATPase [Rhizobium]TBY62805.1 ATP-dependent Clp protease ATP-binding subunit [Rhizobium leguminosarum bv. viciae]MBB3138150.1 ATP-dependent Clp protease ATP-binding subunit ClpA [Rhizobium pisi]RSB64732.1 ATP-dependent Clp protease ATP-binding subunit [Rhizobium pisi]TAV45354.1 ATP-dependent Clp protease ATP-binding subunit [Rhizobium leguminosarum]TAV45912.1 ATP-dependent Clp protease ATP-binding subunit [Rhizobium leguminosarum]